MDAAFTTERLGEQLKAIDEELASVRLMTAYIRISWQDAQTRYTEVTAKAATIATDAYQDAAAMGPFDEYTNGLHEFGLIAPGLAAEVEPAARPPGRDSVLYELRAAEQALRSAQAGVDAADAVEREVAVRRAVVQEQFTRHSAALALLKTRNATLLGPAFIARDAYEDSLSSGMGLGTSVNGMQAAPDAIRAVNFALSQRGKPYLWAAEGPYAYDCSGLVLASYLSVGRSLPRVSRNQYHAGTPVLVSQLLPGDLLFFSTDRSDSRSIHHVAIYIGNGRMVHAPNVGDVVKVSPIWWTRYFGATRIIPAVPGPATPTPTPTPSATPTPSRSPSPSPSPSRTASPSPTGSPSPTASPSPTTSPSPSPTPTPAESPSPSPEPEPDPTPAEPDPTPVEPTEEPSPSTGQSASAAAASTAPLATITPSATTEERRARRRTGRRTRRWWRRGH
jgi:cell wall-associated NlpC family hydrolase